MVEVPCVWDRRAKQDEPLDVLFVGAHPDDVEIGCGGFVHSLSRQGYRVGIVDLTDGEPTPRCARPEDRIAEAVKAAETLGACLRAVLALPNRRLFDGFESRVALAHAFRVYRPRVVVGLAGSTPAASPDHEQAGRITEAAVFYARLCKWESYFDGLPTHQVEVYLNFFLASRFAVLPHPTAVVVDISDDLDAKINAIRCYESQFSHRPEAVERIRIRCQALGQSTGFAAGEFIGHPTGWAFRDLLGGILGQSSGK